MRPGFLLSLSFTVLPSYRPTVRCESCRACERKCSWCLRFCYGPLLPWVGVTVACDRLRDAPSIESGRATQLSLSSPTQCLRLNRLLNRRRCARHPEPGTRFRCRTARLEWKACFDLAACPTLPSAAEQKSVGRCASIWERRPSTHLSSVRWRRAARPNSSLRSGASTTGYRMGDAVGSGFTTSR